MSQLTLISLLRSVKWHWVVPPCPPTWLPFWRGYRTFPCDMAIIWQG